MDTGHPSENEQVFSSETSHEFFDAETEFAAAATPEASERPSEPTEEISTEATAVFDDENNLNTSNFDSAPISPESLGLPSLPSISPEEAAARALVGEPLHPESFASLAPDTASEPTTSTPETPQSVSEAIPSFTSEISKTSEAPETSETHNTPESPLEAIDDPRPSPATPNPTSSESTPDDLVSELTSLDSLTDDEGISATGIAHIEAAEVQLDKDGNAADFYERARGAFMLSNIAKYADKKGTVEKIAKDLASSKRKSPTALTVSTPPRRQNHLSKTRPHAKSPKSLTGRFR